jgi:hypothetical protein
MLRLPWRVEVLLPRNGTVFATTLNPGDARGRMARVTAGLEGYESGLRAERYRVVRQLDGLAEMTLCQLANLRSVGS